ncbi:MAG TPA: S9 family peptidase [Acidimicrobiales bacterium]
MAVTDRPPRAAKRPHALVAHGDERIDEWYWLRDRDDPEVTAHLEAENDFTAAQMAGTKDLQRQLFEEIVGHVQETDLTVPARKGPWLYYARTIEGHQYAIHCRRPPGPEGEGAEAVLLDENAEAGDGDFFDLGNFEVSPGHGLVAWAADTNGGERFTLRFRDLGTGADLDDVVEDTYYSVAWANDSKTVFYTRPDEAMRPWQVWRHRLGTPATADVLVFQEDDEHFFLEVGRTRDDAFVVLQAGSKITTEVRVLDAGDPEGDFRVVARRQHGVEYAIDHHGDRFLVVTNAGGRENFAVMEAPEATPGPEHWRELLPYDPEVRVEDVDAFAHHLVVWERAAGLRTIRVVDLDDMSSYVIDQPEAVYGTWAGANPEFETATLRYQYASMVTPMSVIDFDLRTRRATLLKRQPVPGYDPAPYVTERVWATAGDGARVPISLVYREGLARDGSAPCLLYGYGSYEHSLEPGFSSVRLCLLDRGFVYAVAHVRGGGEMGRPWYEQGKMLHKRNTFTDFVAAADHLVAGGWTSPPRLAARGGSAGGLLMGAVANLRPDLFGAIVAEVPFVDCLTTILDDTLPLTVMEWEEWGNPVADPEVYAYMRSYAPYDNVSAQDYPALLVTAGLNDPRVSYWEPAKWVARLRDRATGAMPILLKTEMGAGHQGPSGRYDAWRDEAFVLAFVLRALGVEDAGGGA